jgi:hypothetical protein
MRQDISASHRQQSVFQIIGSRCERAQQQLHLDSMILFMGKR